MEPLLSVPLSEKRHRLADSEIPEVIAGLQLLLEHLLIEKRESERAEIAFRCLQRLVEKKSGRPKYGEFSWGYLQHYLDSRLSTLMEDNGESSH